MHGRVRLTGALRYEAMDLERVNLDAAGAVEPNGFARAFRWWSWRAGAVVNLRSDVVAYGQVSNAKDPVNANILLVNANQDFDLTDARQWEVGLKADIDGGRTQVTARLVRHRAGRHTRAVRPRQRDDDRRASNRADWSWRSPRVQPATRGSARAWPSRDAAFVPSANFVQLAGNTPPNVPTAIGNLWGSYSNIGGTPLEAGATVRIVGDRHANNANTITLNGYATADAYLALDLDAVRVTFNVDNLTDSAYASWADIFYLGQTDPSFIYANQVLLGAPRTYSVMLNVRF